MTIRSLALNVAALLFLGFGSSFLVGCDDDAAGGCSADVDCARGQVCEAGSCQAIQCTGLVSCPGTGRTCLFDLRTCSMKECGDSMSACDQGLACLEPPSPFAYSCVDPSMVPMDVMPEMPMTVAPGNMTAGAMNAQPAQPAPGPIQLCSQCSADDQCAPLGEGAKCTAIGAGGTFCTSACTPGQDGQCPLGYTCLQNVNQCVPQGFNCSGCLANPCPAGQVCDPTSTMCIPPQQLCQACYGNEYCANGRICSDFMGRDVCLNTCDASGGCLEGFACTDGACVPTTGVCDACGGGCSGDTPVCIASTGQCGECDAMNPCSGGLGCDLMTNTCVERNSCDACDIDAQCGSCAGRPICYSGNCVECLDSTNCPARSECNPQTFTCEYSPCAGVECHVGADGTVGQCDEADGRCENPDGTPSCTSAEDCEDPMTMDCNQDTGQCYYVDAGCDEQPGGPAVCAPGSSCSSASNLLGLPLPAGDPSCTCTPPSLTDPFGQNSGGTGCHPGQTCFSLDSILQGLLGGGGGGLPGFPGLPGGGGMMSGAETAQEGRCCASSNPLDCFGL